MKRTIFGKQLVPVVMVLGLVVGCASKPPAPVHDNMAEVNQAIDGAKAAIAKAKSLNWIWRDTEKFAKEAQAAAGEARKAQVRTVDRSERVRTYNFPESRITDHRIGKKVHNLEEFLAGDIEEMLKSSSLTEAQSSLI